MFWQWYRLSFYTSNRKNQQFETIAPLFRAGLISSGNNRALALLETILG
jgi:hypothetical protein